MFETNVLIIICVCSIGFAVTTSTHSSQRETPALNECPDQVRRRLWRATHACYSFGPASYTIEKPKSGMEVCLWVGGWMMSYFCSSFFSSSLGGASDDCSSCFVCCWLPSRSAAIWWTTETLHWSPRHTCTAKQISISQEPNHHGLRIL